jgi:hypothetical protein
MTVRQFAVWCVAICSAVVLLSCGADTPVQGGEPSAKDIEKARMANEMKAAQNFYALRQKYEDYRKSVRTRKPAARSAKKRPVKGKAASFRAAQVAPARTMWPPFLARVYFVNQRQQIDRLMAERTPGNSGAGSRNCVQVEEAVASLQAAMQEHVREVSPMEYLSAKRHLDGLVRAARTPVVSVIDSVASK